MTEAATLSPETFTIPRYSFTDADHIARLGRGTARRWAAGYRYRYDGDVTAQPPVASSERPSDTPGVSFIELVELVAIGKLKEFDFSLRQIRQIVRNCEEMLSVTHPLASLRFKIGGHDIFVERDGQLVEVGQRRRLRAWVDVLAPFVRDLDYEEQLGFAVRWWPLGRSESVVLDPDYGFGMPVVAKSGVRTEILFERFRAGDLPAQVASDFGLSEHEVERALQFEAQLTPA